MGCAAHDQRSRPSRSPGPGARLAERRRNGRSPYRLEIESPQGFRRIAFIPSPERQQAGAASEGRMPAAARAAGGGAVEEAVDAHHGGAVTTASLRAAGSLAKSSADLAESAGAGVED